MHYAFMVLMAKIRPRVGIMSLLTYRWIGIIEMGE